MECGICYTDDNLVKTNCDHLFCSKCLTIWREIKNNCPMCRDNISYVIKIKKDTPNIEPRVTRSMTKHKREVEFYENFKKIVIEITSGMAHGNRYVEDVRQNINKLIKMCLKNYKIMSLSIYNLVLDILGTKIHHIHNRDIIKKRLIELKPYINYNPTIDM